MEIKKSPKADLERGKTLSVLMGFVVGLAVLFAGFEWSTRDVMVVQESDGVADIIAEEEVEITRPENTPPPPPPPPRANGARRGRKKRCIFDRAHALSYVMSPFQGYTSE